jgi:hypothetical protein
MKNQALSNDYNIIKTSKECETLELFQNLSIDLNHLTVNPIHISILDIISNKHIKYM